MFICVTKANTFTADHESCYLAGMSTIHLSDRVSSSDSHQAITLALQAAIDEASASGGIVVVSPGTWVITTIFLRSNMTLRLERGSKLQAHTDIEAYPELPRGHNKDRQPFHLLHAQDCHDLVIEGDGTIDGQGEAFWDPPLGDVTQGAVGLFYRHKGKRISPLLEIRNCQRVKLRDFTIENSPGWTVHLNCCDQVQITGLTLNNNLFGPNTDGFDINGCRDVFVSNCELHCGDDAIILKSTDDARSCERIMVTNCMLETNCAALGLGAEVHHAIRDITFSNCTVKAAIRIIQFEMWSAGVIENVSISNISGKTMAPVPLERPIYLDIQHHRRTDGKLGILRNVTISNLTCETRGRIMLTAADGACIENVIIRDVVMRYPEIEDPKHTVNHMNSSQMSNDSPLTRDARAAVVLDNVRDCVLENIQTHWPDESASQEMKQDAAWPGIHATLPMHAVVMRNAENTVINCPHLTPSQTGIEHTVVLG